MKSTIDMLQAAVAVCREAEAVFHRGQGREAEFDAALERWVALYGQEER